MIPRLFQMIKFQIELVAIATCIILNFYYLEEVWSLKITPKCYCFHFSDLITKHRNSHSIPNPQKVKVSIKFWKLQTIFETFKPKEKVLDGFKLPAPQECFPPRPPLDVKQASQTHKRHLSMLLSTNISIIAICIKDGTRAKLTIFAPSQVRTFHSHNSA